MVLEQLAKTLVAEARESIGEVARKVGDATDNFFDQEKRLNPVEKSPSHHYDGLTPLEKVIGWSKDYPLSVLDAMYSGQELKHYMDLNLVPKLFAKTEMGQERYVLVPQQLEMTTKVDSFGRTNQERLDNGLLPIKDGKILECHHIGQENGGHYALLTKEEHRENTFKSLLHNPAKEGVDHGLAFITDKKLISRAISEGDKHVTNY
ncbi:HNH/ENDO VII family nuclease [Streptococcus entericus]|uniref:HNH/ENDO VII family nuclease n=1 Tax=Streptococcus entericus TaxID=155680 RepID=UPI0003746F5F|nr:HNH/ENDO VII family nuclease [Streptococcus entericus]